MKPYAPYLAVGIAAFVLLFFVSDPAAEWLARLLAGRSAQSSEVAKLVELNGEAKTITDGVEASVKGPLTNPVVIRDGQRLEVNKGATAILILNSQDELRVEGGSNLGFQLWNVKDAQSPVYVTILQGKVDLVRPGVRGRAYMVSDGKLYLPGQSAQTTRALLVLNKNEIDLNMSENQLEETPEAATTDETAELPDNGPAPDTLSNEYIDETIARRQIQIQKCWLSRMKDNPVQKGKVVVQFEINRRGKVKDAKVIDSELNDSTLHNCIVGVVERISFRSFKGAEISLSYPIQFE